MAVDWRKIAGQKYPNVVSNVQGVGYVLAEALNEMVDQGLPRDNIHVVGHSMGAQVAGFLGRQTSFELRRITGENMTSLVNSIKFTIARAYRAMEEIFL